MLAVVALGIFMGKYMFKLMELKSTQNSTTSSNNSNTLSASNQQGSVQVLYGDKSDNSSNTVDVKQLQNIQATETPKLTNQVNNASSSSTTASNNTNSEKANSKPANDNSVFSPTGPRWYAYASTNGLNVRETPDKKGKFMFKVAKGTRGVVKEKKDGWTYIQWDFNKKKGWSIDDYLVQGPANIVENVINKTADKKIENISKDQLTQAKIEKEIETSKTIIGIATSASLTDNVITYTNGKELPKKGTITPTNGANIREAPSTQSAKLVKLPKGTTVGIKSVKQVDQYQWFEITYSNGAKTGWTREDNLKF
jgi:hypothetical protein